MSINVLTSEALEREIKRLPGVGGGADNTLRYGEGDLLYAEPAGMSHRPALLDQRTSPVNQIGARGSTVTDSLNLLVKYIPTEVVTLYVAAMSAAPALRSQFPTISSANIYWAFGILTPILLFLVYVNKRATAGLQIVPHPREWPWWRLTAATIAYLVWALAVPGNPYIAEPAAAVLAGLGAVFISTVLNLLEPVFERRSA